jgi:ABC-type spermidine/putrescine transport system permease subunit II
MPPLSRNVAILAWAILAFLLLPALVVIPAAFSRSEFLSFPPTGFSVRWFAEFFTGDKWLAPAARSLRIAVIVSLLATALASFAAILLMRCSPLLNKLARVIFMAPITLPVIIYAVAVYGLYAKLRLVGTDIGLILAHTVLALPFPFLTVSAALATMDRSIPRAAASCGANGLRAFGWVILPMIRPAIAAGALFAFLTSFDEVVVAMFVGGTDSTLPKRMLDDIFFELTPTLAAIATMLTCITAVVILTTSGKRLPFVQR